MLNIMNKASLFLQQSYSIAHPFYTGQKSVSTDLILRNNSIGRYLIIQGSNREFVRLIPHNNRHAGLRPFIRVSDVKKAKKSARPLINQRHF